MKVLAGGKFVVMTEGGTWPTPMDEVETSLEWRLRYANPEQLVKDRFLAASIVSAYREMIRLPRWRRDEVVGQLRKAIGSSQPDRGTEHEA
jgi:hypothetical protein